MPYINSTNAGKVTGIWGGAAMLRTADGKIRRLKLDDIVYKGDAILTTQDGIVQITTGDGTAQVAETLDLLTPVVPGDGKTAPTSVAAATDAAPDGLEVLGPAAAGLTGGEAGDLGPGLRVDRIVEGLTAASPDQPGSVARQTFAEPDLNATETGSRSDSTGPTPAADNPPQPSDDSASTTEGQSTRGNVLDNDSDPDGDTLTVVQVQVGGNSVAVPAGGSATVSLPEGTLVIGSDGAYVFTPAAGFTGDVPPVEITVSDGSQTATSTLSITVDPVNEVPVAPPDAVIVAEDSVATGNVLDNDSDFDGDALAVTQFEVGGTTHAAGTTATLDGVGSLRIDADGHYVFTPLADYDGPVPVATYTVSDGQANANSTLTITITPEFDPPVAANDSIVVQEDSGPNRGNVLGNDHDPDGDALQVTGFSFGGVQAAAGETAFVDGVGWLTIASDGAYSFSPFPDYTGPVPIASYTVSDGRATASATLSIRIEMISDDPPQAADDAYTTPEDTPITIDAATLTANDTDRDGDALTVVSVQDAHHGTVELVGGQVVFTPEADYTGPAGFTYTVIDPAGLSSTATVTLDVQPVNDAPDAAADTAAGTEDGGAIAGSVLDNDSDPDGDPLQVTQFVIGGTTYAAGTTATVANVGTLVIEADGRYTFTPVPDFNGPVPPASYTVSDGTVTATATLDITVGPVNDAPLAIADSQAIAEDGIATGNVLANDADAEGDALVVTQFVVDGTTYAAGSTATIAAVGALVIEADGTYSFTPLPDFSGAMPTATYTVSDGSATASATLAVTVAAANDAPVANADAQTVAEDAIASGNVLDNDGDADGDTLTVTQFSVAGAVHAAGTTAVIAGVGSIVVNADGSYVFTPVADYDGAVPTLAYAVSDGTAVASSTLTIAITAANDAPVALRDTRTVGEDSGASTGNVLTNDRDAEGDALVVTGFAVGGASYAPGDTATITGIGSVSIGADGGYVFTPAPDYTGVVPAVTYTVSDGTSTATATLDLAVSADNDGPVGTPDSAVIAEGGVAIGNVLANDSDADGDTLSVTQFEVGGQTYAAGAGAVLAGIGSLVIGADGTYTFTPLPDYNGAMPEATYTVSDGSATTSSTLNVAVGAANDAPVANPDSVQVDEDAGAHAGNLLANDGDVDGDTLSVTQFSIGGTVYAAGSTAVIAGAGTLLVEADGRYVFTPAPDFNGTPPVVQYTISDGSISAASTLSLTVAAVNDAPVALDDTRSANEDGSPVSGNVLGNDADADGDALAVTQFSVGGNVYAAGSTATLAGVGTLVVDADGDYVFTPAPDFNGSVPSAVYTVTDGTSTASAALNIGITPANDGPAASPDSATIDEDGGPAAGNVLDNDFDLDGDTLAVTQFSVAGTVHAAGETATLPGIGTLVIQPDGSYLFTPAAGFNGAMPTATVTVSDGAATATSMLDVAVTPVNDAPVAGADAATMPEDGAAVSGNVLGNDSDPDGDALGVTQFTIGGTTYVAGATAVIDGVGSLVVNADGGYSFTPLPDFNGSVPTVTYTASDGSATTTAALTIRVTATNDGPVAVDDAANADEDVPNVTGNVLANDRDADGDALSVTQFSVNGGLHAAGATATLAGVGSLVIHADGSYTFTPEADFSGSVPPVSYTVTDGSATSAATLALTIGAVNDAPIAVPDQQVVPEDGTAVGNVLANDRDADGDTLAVLRFDVGGATYNPGETAGIAGVGRLTIEADGDWRFVPEPDYAGPVPSVTYTVGDGTAATTSTLDIQVAAANDAPDAVDDGSNALAGLLGEYHAFAENVDGPSLAGLAQAAAWADADSVDATFSAITPDYGSVTGNLGGDGRLQAFLGSDAGSLDHDPRNSSDAVIRFSGELTLAAGSYNFRVTADDGYSIRIDGVVVAEYPNNQSPTTRVHPAFTIADGGSHSVEIVYWDQGGEAVFRPEISGNGGASYAGLGSFNLVHSTFSTHEDTALALDPAQLLSNDRDADGDALSIVSVQDATHGSVALVGGRIVFTPAADYHGPASFSYTVSDGHGGTDTATVHLAVGSVNDAPVARSDAPAGLLEDGGPFGGNVLANDGDADGTPLTVTQFVIGTTTYAAGSTATIAGVGTLVVNANGSYTFTPVPDFAGAVPAITYTASDGLSSGTATLNLSIAAQNDAPVNTLPVAFAGIEDTALSLSGLSVADVDAGGGTLSVTLAVGSGVLAAASGGGVSVAGSGSASITLTGTLADLDAYLGNAARQPVYTPPLNASGPVALTMTTSDGSRTDVDGATIQVAAVADVPALAATVKTYTITTGFEEGGGGSLAVISGGAWHTHNSSGSVEINTQATYQGGSSSNRVLELERSAGDAGDLYTDIATRAGEVYTLDLGFMARSGAQGNSVINIVWDGETIGRLDSSSTTLTNHSFWFIATTTGTSRLSFVAEDSNSTGGLLDDIKVAIKEHAGMQGYQVNLSSIAAALADTDGSEALRLAVGSIPAGMQLHDGSGGHVSAIGAATVDVTGWNLDELVVVPGSGYAAGTSFNLSVTATATESSNGSAASTTATVPITVLSDVNDVVGSDGGNDARTGTSSNDMMWGLGGHDTFSGGNGNDTMLGNGGDDALSGGNGNDRLSGGRGNDTLVGGQNGDYLHGGSGNDSLTGGNAGATPATTPSVTDVFSWHLGDAGSAGAPARDVITDFKYAAVSSGGDVLDLRDLLQGETGSNLSNYLHFSYDSGTAGTTISISTSGGFSGGFSSARVDQEITLAGVNLTSIGSDAQIISDLIGKKQLNVDTA